MVVVCVGVLSLACGTVKEGGGGGGPDDVDAAVEEQPIVPDPVTVVARYNLQPSPGAFVFYHDTDGTPLGEAVTDENGVVVLTEVPAGGAVTVWLRHVMKLESVLAVQPGDVLTFDEADPRDLGDGPSSLLTMNVRTPASGQGTLYQLLHPCKPASTIQVAPNTTVVTDVLETCADEPNIPIVSYGIAAGAPVRVDGSAVDEVPFKTLQSAVAMPAGAPLGNVEAFLPARNGNATTRIWPVYRHYFMEVPQTLNLALTGTEQSVLGPRFVPDIYEAFRVNGQVVNNTNEFTQTLFVAANIDGTISTDGENPSPADLTGALTYMTGVDLVSEDPLSISYQPGSIDCENGVVDMRYAAAIRALNDATVQWWVYGPDGSGALVYPRLPPFSQSQLWPLGPGSVQDMAAGFFSNSTWTYDEIRNSPSISNFVNAPTLGAPVGELSCGAQYSRAVPN